MKENQDIFSVKELNSKDIILKRDTKGTAHANVGHVIYRHSYDGFEWGYLGSGPAELALNILIKFTSKEKVENLYQRFKREVIAKVPREGSIIAAEYVENWLKNNNASFNEKFDEIEWNHELEKSENIKKQRQDLAEEEQKLIDQIKQGHPDPIESRGNLKIIEENDNYLKGELYFKGFSHFDSSCGLTIKNLQSGKTRVIFTELPDNKGTSVTNMIEDLATLTYHSYLKDIQISQIEWIEHYLADDNYGYMESSGFKRSTEETFDLVTFYKFDGKRFYQPKWQRIKKNQLDD